MGRGAMRVDEALSPSPQSERNMTVKVLAVGDPSEWAEQGNALPGGGIAFISISDVSEELLANHAPTVVFSPVLARRFDCIELAVLLHNIGYTGSYRAMAKDLPKPELIEREVREICPRLDFKILVAN